MKMNAKHNTAVGFIQQQITINHSTDLFLMYSYLMMRSNVNLKIILNKKYTWRLYNKRILSDSALLYISINTIDTKNMRNAVLQKDLKV